MDQVLSDVLGVKREQFETEMITLLSHESHDFAHSGARGTA